jgi:hypothetical protein
MTRRVGRRGAALLFFAVLDLIYAFSLFNPAPSAVATPALQFVASLVPLWAWATAWLIVGLLCLIGAFWHEDSIAWTAAMAIKVLWGSVFLLGWLLVHLERGYVSAAIWLCTAALVALLAGWPEPNGRATLWSRRPH